MADTSNPKLEEIGGRIRILRKQKDWTIEALAWEAGLTSSQVSEIERGLRDAQLTTYMKIADALDVSIAVLLSSDSTNEKKDDEFIEIYKKMEEMDSDNRKELLKSFKSIVFMITSR